MGSFWGKQQKIQVGLLERIQHCDLYVELQNEWEYITVRSAVREVTAQLCGLTRSKHLRTTISESESWKNGSKDLEFNQTLLHPVSSLRNIARVDVSGDVSPDYVRYVKNIIKGNSPRNDLPKMYHAL